MPCCGKNRTAEGTVWSQGSRGGASSIGSHSLSAVAYFHNAGTSGITAWGPASGKMYRFPASGLAVAVDPNDVASISRVPHLKPVRPR